MEYLFFLVFSTGLAVLARSLYEAKAQPEAARPALKGSSCPGSAGAVPPIRRPLRSCCGLRRRSTNVASSSGLTTCPRFATTKDSNASCWFTPFIFWRCWVSVKNSDAETPSC